MQERPVRENRKQMFLSGEGNKKNGGIN